MTLPKTENMLPSTVSEHLKDKCIFSPRLEKWSRKSVQRRAN